MNRPFGLPNRSSERVLDERIAQGWLPRGWIDGLTIANDTTDATNDISISPGVCRSTVNKAYVSAYTQGYSTEARHQRDIEIPATIIKQLDVAWAPAVPGGGGRSGGRTNGAISNTTWHVYAVGGGGMRDDVMLCDSVAQATVLAALPGGYTAYRRIASVIRSSGAILGFVQAGDRFDLKDSVLNHNNTLADSNAFSLALTVPNGIVVDAILNVGLAHVGGSAAQILISALSQTDEAASTTNATVCTNGNSTFIGSAVVRTNTSGQIRVRGAASAGIANAGVQVRTRGWFDHRGKDN